MTTPEPPAAPPAGTDPAAAAVVRAHGRAGRDLPVAVVVGAGLVAVVVASLVVRKEAFVAVAALAVVLAVWELATALAARGLRVPVVPVTVGSVAMLVAAYTAGPEGLGTSFAVTALAVAAWASAERGPDSGIDLVRDVAGGVFTVAYVPLLAGSAVLLLTPPDGPRRVVLLVLLTAASDTGGYVAGVLLGSRPMAPSVSPKKSWEGFGGSVLACVLVGVVAVPLLLGGAWQAGLATGLAAVGAATLGDLGESLLKRDLGIKDMSALLPGHGGVMDRLDSLLLAAPAVWVLLHLTVPLAGG